RSAAPTRTPHRILRVTVSGASGRAVARGRALGRWLEAHAPRRARGEVAIAVVADADMRRLNAKYRGKDAATAGLSFRADASERRSGFLGDIVIAAGVAARQARAEGHSSAVERRVLALHGLLHLLGYDHDTDQGTMRRVEDRLRRRAGLPS